MFKTTILAAVLAATATAASAGPLTGQTLGASGSNKPVSPASAVVGAGVEFTEANLADLNFTNDFLIDFDENGLVKVSFVLPANIGGMLVTGPEDLQVFSDVNGTIAAIIGFDLVSTSGVTGIDQSDLGFTSESVSLSLGSGASWDTGSFITAQIRFAVPTGVPEPQTLALAGLGLIAAVASSRRTRSVA